MGLLVRVILWVGHLGSTCEMIMVSFTFKVERLQSGIKVINYGHISHNDYKKFFNTGYIKQVFLLDEYILKL